VSCSIYRRFQRDAPPRDLREDQLNDCGFCRTVAPILAGSATSPRLAAFRSRLVNGMPGAKAPLVPNAEDVRLDLLTVSLLRGSFDTRANRFAKQLLDTEGPADLVPRVASLIWPALSQAQPEIDRARREAKRALASMPPGSSFITFVDQSYPDLLRTLADPPLVLWIKGPVELLFETCVGIVGSRDALPVSLAIARKLGRELSDAGVTVVSGLAVGVDGAAHAGALEGAGRTIAVLGSGLDHVYPPSHAGLASQILERGAIVTELPPDAQPSKTHFPLRNRIISGLSRAVLVVEAGEKSGSLITARMATQQNRSVMAVPGGPLSGRHRGSNGLIKDGARLVETVEDILDEIRWCGPIGVQKVSNPLETSELEANMALGENYSVDELARRTGRIAGDLLAELATLELAGRVTRLAGGQFARFPR
jgi:DNA processing protein